MFKFLNLFVLFSLFFTTLQSVAMTSASSWLDDEAKVAEILLLKNISPAFSVRGTIVASPQTENPNYFRHWTRDAALTMDVVLNLAAKNKKLKLESKPIQYYDQVIKDYVALTRHMQSSAYLGEPIFEVNGMAFLGPWGRPQNDGPALRAIVLINWANQLLDEGKTDFVAQNLYSAAFQKNSVIKTDLEYVSWYWTEPCFDLWEEVKANHFYTKMVQRKSLLLGAKLARRLHDGAAADWYELQARYLENSIQLHLNKNPDWIGASLNYVEGLNSKSSNLDIAVILGVLHGSYDAFFSPADVSVQNTFRQLTDVFTEKFPVNRESVVMAPALGRYPEDRYAGTNFEGGNPWVLATLAGAEYSYRVAALLAAKDAILAKKWLRAGDAFVQRVQYHANGDGSLSEQIDRTSGYMTSARDLTWNYAAVLTTLWARQQGQQSIKKMTTKGK